MGSLFDPCVNVIAAATILSVTYGGQIIVPADCFNTDSVNTITTQLLHNETGTCNDNSSCEKGITLEKKFFAKPEK